MIERKLAVETVRTSLAENPVTAILGPRQCGKTTLAHQVIGKGEGVFFDLENPTHLSRLSSPLLAFQNQTKTIVIDEIQRMPRLFETLRVLVDDPSFKEKFICLTRSTTDMLLLTAGYF